MNKYGYNQNNVNKSGSDEYPSEKEINNSNQTPLNQSEEPSPEQLIKEHNDYIQRQQIKKEEDNKEDDSYDSDDSSLCDDCNGCGCRECCGECCGDCLNSCKSECADCCDCDGGECCRCLNDCNCNCSNNPNLGLLFFCCFCV